METVVALIGIFIVISLVAKMLAWVGERSAESMPGGPSGVFPARRRRSARPLRICPGRR